MKRNFNLLFLSKEKELLEDIDVYNLKAAGFAHGLSGKAYVLFVSSIYFMDKKGFKEAITHLGYIDAMLENRIRLNSEYIKYMDLSWCEGISGIAMALLRSQYILEDKVKFNSLNLVPGYLLKNYSVLESNLCHGKESIIGYFNDAMLRYKSVSINKYINLLVNFELSTGERESTKEINFWDETGYTHNLDYGTGQTGIVETCLRALKNEDRLFYLTEEQEKN